MKHPEFMDEDTKEMLTALVEENYPNAQEDSGMEWNGDDILFLGNYVYMMWNFYLNWKAGKDLWTIKKLGPRNASEKEISECIHKLYAPRFDARLCED